MHIQCDPASMTQEQREAVAGFILAYPASPERKEMLVTGLTLQNPRATPAADISNWTEITEPCAEITQLAKEGGEFDASVAFGVTANIEAAVTSAFGTPPVTAQDLHTLAPGFAAQVFPVAGSVPQTVNLNGQVELDKAGLPWDARIHASTKTKTQPGLWTSKRGLDPALKVSVEAELRALMGLPSAPPVAPQPPAPPVPAVALVAPPAPIASVSAPDPIVSATFAPAPQAPIGTDARQAFVSLIGRASAAMQGGKLTQAEVQSVCASIGIPALPLLANRLDLVPQIAAQIDALIASKQ